MTTAPKSQLLVVVTTKLVSYVAYLLVLLAEVILLLGFLMRLGGANTSADFTEWVYRSLDRVMAPFRGIFDEITFENSDSVLEVSILFAMVVYGLVAIAVQALIDALERRQARLERETATEESEGMR